MSKKRINIALLILVLVLWGTVGYKTVNQYFFSKEIDLKDFQSNTTFNFNQIEKDTFNLELVQRDPFLNKNTIAPRQNLVVKKKKSKPVVIPKPIIVPKPIVNWPSVSYYGYIKSKDKTEELILVKIDNSLYKLRKNSEINGLIIKKVFNDSIEVLFDKKKRIIRVGN